MYYLGVHIVILFYGVIHVRGFFHFRHQDFYQFLQTSNFQDDDTFWIEQPVDHFNKSDQRTWKMKYYQMIDLWKPGGPILVYLVGETPLRSRSVLSKSLPYNDSDQSLLSDLVEDIGAAWYTLEHRFYGDSKPLDEPTPENLVFLTSKQALADAAFFIESLKKSSDFANSKVIVVGGSYAGNLAAWMKVMYPNLVDAVFSSSAPVLAKKDFYEYFETVTDTFRTYGTQDCVDRISEKFSTYSELLQTPEGIEKLKNEENICSPVDMTVPESQQLFFSIKMEEYATIAQYKLPRDVVNTCDSLDLNTLSLKNNFSSLWNEELGCYDYDYFKVVKDYFSRPLLYWFYQTCTEFGYFQSTTSNKQMFGAVLPVDFYYKTCSVLFGEQFNEQRVDQGVLNTNNMYGGLTPNVNNVVFVNGDMDPWHRLSILQDLSADVPAIYIEGSSHCHEMHRYTENDSESLKEARNKIKNLIKKWIGVQ